MINEETEFWKDFRKQANDKKQSNKESSTAILDSEGITYTSHNYGVHLVVTHNNKTVDYWPSTGKFINRHTGWKGRGIKKLLGHLNYVGKSSD
jgi:hypothetical protein